MWCQCRELKHDPETVHGIILWKLTRFTMLFLCVTSCLARSALFGLTWLRCRATSGTLPRHAMAQLVETWVAESTISCLWQSWWNLGVRGLMWKAGLCQESVALHFHQRCIRYGAGASRNLEKESGVLMWVLKLLQNFRFSCQSSGKGCFMDWLHYLSGWLST